MRMNLANTRDWRAGRFDEGTGGLAALVAGLLLEDEAAQRHLHALDLGSLAGGDGGQQAGDRVEGAVGVVAGEGLLVRPLVAPVAQLADQAALGVAEDEVACPR
jgi:hypothetical protein